MPGAADGEFDAALKYAVGFVARRERFASEVRAALATKGVEEVTIEKVVDHLERRKIVDDLRAAQELLRRFSGRRAAGNAKLRAELERRGASPVAIESALSNPPAERDSTAVLQVLRSHYPRGATREKAARFLFSRGFEEDQIERALTEFGVE